MELQEKIRALNEKKPEGNLRQVEREIEEIDWKIQTTSLPVKEEQDLVNRVRQLEAQLVVQKQIKKVKQKLFTQISRYLILVLEKLTKCPILS